MDAADGAPAGDGRHAAARCARWRWRRGRWPISRCGEARIRERFGVTVVAIRRRDGDVVLNPSPDAVLRDGDHIRVFGLPEQIRALRVAAESA